MPRKPIKLVVKPRPGRNYIHLGEIKRKGAGTGAHKTAKDRPRDNLTRRWNPEQEEDATDSNTGRGAMSND